MSHNVSSVAAVHENQCITVSKNELAYCTHR